ncbi:MAG: glycosyltransferase family 4 protein [Cyanobacteriota bacterium]|nr:glycosyltransferase family 4 protein [Cyanobacteriota bacterium]
MFKVSDRLSQLFRQKQTVLESADRAKDFKTTRSTPTLNLSIVTQFYPPDYAATGQLIQELATQLSQQGIDVHVFTGQPGYAFDNDTAPTLERSPGLSVRRSRMTRLWPKRIRGKALNGLLFCFRAGLHLLKSCWRGDVLLLTSAPPFLPALGYLANLYFDVPYIYLVYDLYPDVAIELKVTAPDSWIVRYWKTLNRKILQNAKAIVVMSPTMKERTIAKCKGIADKISIVHNWADPTWIKPIPKAENWFVRQHQLADRFVVLYSGNLGRCHDVDTILAAAQLLQNEPIQFVFIGDGAKKTICREKVDRSNLQNCLFLPYQDKQVLPYSLTAGDLSLVSIAPGLEGTIAPSKLYGILASGRPVAAICESHSYLRPLLSDAGCGEAFAHGDGEGLARFIRTLAADPEKARCLGEAGRRYLESHFTPQIIAGQYLQLLLPLGERLKQAGLLCQEQVMWVLETQQTQQPRQRFGEILVREGILPRETVDFFCRSMG